MVERLECQLFSKTTQAFHFDAVEQNQDKYAQRHRQGDVHVRRRHHAQRRQTQYMLSNVRQQVDRQQIHQVHQEYPDENRQGQWRDKLAFAVVHVFHATVDKTNNQLNRGLEFPRDAAGGLFGYATEHHQEQQTQNHREKHGVNVESPEGGRGVMRIHQRKRTKVNLKVIQMVAYVLLRC